MNHFRGALAAFDQFGVFIEQIQNRGEFFFGLNGNIFDAQSGFERFIKRPAFTVGPVIQIYQIIGLNPPNRPRQNAVHRRSFMVIIQEFQIRQNIKDDFLGIQSFGSDKVIRDAVFLQGVAKIIGARVGARQNREIRPAHIRILFFQRNYFFYHEPCFIGEFLAVEVNDFRFTTYLGDKFFRQLFRRQFHFQTVRIVLLDESVRQVKDILPAAVILVKKYFFGARIFVLEFQNIGNGSAAEFVNGLVIVADDGDIVFWFG